jgi:hypothetical protein
MLVLCWYTCIEQINRRDDKNIFGRQTPYYLCPMFSAGITCHYAIQAVAGSRTHCLHNKIVNIVHAHGPDVVWYFRKDHYSWRFVYTQHTYIDSITSMLALYAARRSSAYCLTRSI